MGSAFVQGVHCIVMQQAIVLLSTSVFCHLDTKTRKQKQRGTCGNVGLAHLTGVTMNA